MGRKFVVAPEDIDRVVEIVGESPGKYNQTELVDQFRARYKGNKGRATNAVSAATIGRVIELRDSQRPHNSLMRTCYLVEKSD